jgi:hypothetical protein
MITRKIDFIPKNNPRLENGDLGFDWCDRCGNINPAYIVIHTKADTFRLCKGCLLEGISIIDQTILKDAIEKGLKKR